MRQNKLVSSMSTTIAAIFVSLGMSLFYSYFVVKLLVSGGMPSTFSIETLLNFAVLAVDLLSVLLLVFCFVGRNKANKGTGKGLFIVIAIFQLLTALLMLAFSGYNAYDILKNATGDILNLFLLEISLYILPWILAGIAVLVAFFKTCIGMKGAKAEKVQAVQAVENFEVEPQPQEQPAPETVEPQEPQRQAPPPPPPPIPPQPPTYTNPYE